MCLGIWFILWVIMFDPVPIIKWNILTYDCIMQLLVDVPFHKKIVIILSTNLSRLYLISRYLFSCVTNFDKFRRVSSCSDGFGCIWCYMSARKLLFYITLRRALRVSELSKLYAVTIEKGAFLWRRSSAALKYHP